jgi:mono/diheme cytochrome c family protein
MISRAGAIVVIAASVAIMADLAVLQSQRAAATQKSREMYQSVYNGWKWWHVYCFRCHGTNAVGTTLAPDLTDPNGKLPLKEFLRIVQNGSDDGNMQSWAKLLDEKQITQLYYYVRARADKVLPQTESPHHACDNPGQHCQRPSGDRHPPIRLDYARVQASD